MRKILLPLLALCLLTAFGQDRELLVVREWVSAVLAHQPGVVDAPLIQIASDPPENFRVVDQFLRVVLRKDFERPEERNDVLRRGALLHTDIALLMPVQAAAYQAPAVYPGIPSQAGGALGGRRPQPPPGSVITSIDGEYLNSLRETGHWSFASRLLGDVTPDPASDEFVRLWYRAIAAKFQNAYQLGSGTYHLGRALGTLQRDPVILFYAGALHESLASPRFQNIPITTPEPVNLPSGGEQLRTAEGFLTVAVRSGAPLEAQLRLGRVLGGLGKHAEAITRLREVSPPADDRQFQYLRALFLGTELAAVGQLDVARDSFEHAAALYPTAQAPLIALSDMYRRAGQRTAALAAIRRLGALPSRVTAREDPWLDYGHSYAADADRQLTAVRLWVDHHRP